MATKKKKLEKRLYFLTMYNLSQIQIGIQSLHAAIEYSLKYGKDKEYQEWAKTHKTVILLNGGTSNNVQPGTMELNYMRLIDNKVKCAAFYEPDLNNSLSAIAFLVDERVFNKKDYPDFTFGEEQFDMIYGDSYKLNYPDKYEKEFDKLKNTWRTNYVKKVGKDVAFMKEFLIPFRMA